MSLEQSFEAQTDQFILSDLTPEAIDELIEVAKQWVRSNVTGEIETEEIEEIRNRMVGSLETHAESNGYHYFMVRNEMRKAIGFCAIRNPEPQMEPFKSTPTHHSAELVNLFLDDSYRRRGIGYQLVLYTLEQARIRGYDEVIWNSGPRYKSTSWDFYRQFAGEPVGSAYARYGFTPEGIPINAPVWRKTF